MGNKQSQQTVVKIGIGTTLTVTSILCPPIGLIAAGATTVTGVGMTITGAITEDQELVDVGLVFFEPGAGVLLGNIAGTKSAEGKTIVKKVICHKHCFP